MKFASIILNFWMVVLNHKKDEIEKTVIARHITDPENNFALVAIDETNNVLGMLLAEKTYSPWLLSPNVVHISNIGVFESMRG